MQEAKRTTEALTQAEAWTLGGEIIDQGLAHPCMQVISNACQDLLNSLAKIQLQSANLKKFGVGRTEDPTLIIAELVPALRNLSEVLVRRRAARRPAGEGLMRFMASLATWSAVGVPSGSVSASDLAIPPGIVLRSLEVESDRTGAVLTFSLSETLTSRDGEVRGWRYVAPGRRSELTVWND